MTADIPQTIAPIEEDWSTKPRTRMGRLVPALMVSQIGNYIALLTPLQLLLTLHLTDLLDGSDATSAFGVVTGFGALCALLFNPIGGRISDLTTARFGRRRTWILFGALAGAVALVAISFTTEVWQVVVLWCVIQALFNFQSAATTALVPDQVPPLRRGGVSGLLGLTIAIGPLLGIGIANSVQAGSPTQWHVIAAVAAVAGVIAVLLVRDPRQHIDRAARRLDLRAIAQTFWINPRRHPAFGWAWLVRFLITCVFASGTYNAFFLIQRFGISTADVGAIVLGLSLLSVALLAVSSVVAGYLSDLVKRQKPFVVGAGLLGATGLLLMAFAPSVTVVYVATAIIGLATGAFFAIDLAMCVRVLPSSKDAGKDLAIINIANSLPQSVVPFLAPVLLMLGGYTLFFGFLAVLGVLGAVAVLRVPEIGQEHGAPGVAPLTRS
ncbi:MFS transporter [Diaminobutyricimonas aerilata]|uniref:MFS transporter n=1 Tax=Diaminobutyricimonas aerilata TaxID=1162967 RepID=A0A2M9CM56_9MICO|nr:MFS transporter [Diaminobutyricimonas aerilata]PJJ72985.1 MFS transporter [Diaminobutyricimonas aerilata]